MLFIRDFDFTVLKEAFIQIREANLKGSKCKGVVKLNNCNKYSMFNYMNIKLGDYSSIKQVVVYLYDNNKYTEDFIEFNGVKDIKMLLDYLRFKNLLN